MRTLLLSLALAGALFAQDQPLPDGASLAIVVQDAQGEVDVRVSARDKWLPASKGMRLAVGSRLCTGVESGVVVSFGTNSVALVSACSMCEIQAFEVRGEELVAKIHIEPGVAQVNVKQLPQFHTDFQVSTPRMTCSVRGSGVVVESSCDERGDTGVCIEHEAVATDQAGDEHSLVENEETNNEGQSNLEIEVFENVVDAVEGESEPESEDENLLANNAGGLDLNTSDANVDSDASPSGFEGELEPPDDEEGLPHELQEALALLAEHGYGELIDFMREGPDTTGERMKAAQDQWDDVNFNLHTDEIYQEKRDAILLLDANAPYGGVLHDHRGLDYPHEHALLHAYLEETHLEDHAMDSQEDQNLTAWHELAHELGLRTTVDQAATEMLESFDQELDATTGLTQAQRDAREGDFHNGPVGFDQMLTDLHALTDQAASGEGFDTDLYGKSLVELLHARYHERLAGLPEGEGPTDYTAEHQGFHTDVVDDLVTILQTEGVHAMIEAKSDHLHELWHDQTGVPENVAEGQPGFEEHEALHQAMDEFQDKADYAADHAQD